MRLFVVLLLASLASTSPILNNKPKDQIHATPTAQSVNSNNLHPSKHPEEKQVSSEHNFSEAFISKEEPASRNDAVIESIKNLKNVKDKLVDNKADFQNIPKQADLKTVLNQADFQKTLNQADLQKVLKQADEKVPIHADKKFLKQADEKVSNQADKKVFKEADENIPKQADKEVLKQAVEKDHNQADVKVFNQADKKFLKNAHEKVPKQADVKVPKQAEVKALHQADKKAPNQADLQLSNMAAFHLEHNEDHVPETPTISKQEIIQLHLDINELIEGFKKLVEMLTQIFPLPQKLQHPAEESAHIPAWVTGPLLEPTLYSPYPSCLYSPIPY